MRKLALLIVPLLLCFGKLSATNLSEDIDLVSESDVELTPFMERRVDRGINKKKYMLKGEYMVGVSASYNSLNTDNAEYFTLITNMNVSGSIVSIKPFGAYLYRDNRAVGFRFGYVDYSGKIESTTLDLGESNDLSFDVPYVSLSSKNYSYAIFHRAYAPLDDKGNVGLFAEVELSTTHGITTFSYENSGQTTTTYSDSQSYDLSFNPGISAFFFNNVCASLSFQFGGLNYTNIKQYDENMDLVGTRNSSKMRFMFNVFAINFGITTHFW
ncbi:MAG: hypothetical protein SNG27_08015 [Rikenellaceae bacterium]